MKPTMRTHSTIRAAFGAVLLIMACASSRAEGQRVAIEIFSPSGGRGSVIVVASGNSGPEQFRDFSANLAAQGYFVALIDGKDVSIRPNDAGGRDGAANLRSVIREAQSSPDAVPGKVALVGLSIGGIGILGFGAPLKDLVSAVVLYYPALTFVGPDLGPMSAAMQVPILVFAGGKDTFAGCCSIDTMKAFEAAPKSVPFQLVVYPEAGHAFNLKTASAPLVYRQQDAEDAWLRTLEFLARHHPAKP